MLLRVLVVCLALCVLTSVVESATNKPRIARERLLPNGKKVPVEVHQEEEDFLVNWIKDQQHKNPELSDVFKEHVPEHVNSLETMGDYIHKTPGLLQNEAAADAFKKQFGFDVDPACTDDKLKYWYRQYDGSCNWMRKGESQLGATNWPRMRDFDQTTYADGYNTPREGPNARDVSNKFFQRKKKFEYNHSAVLLALIEFVMHDVTYSENNYTDLISVPMPAGEEKFSNTTVLKVPRTVKQDGTGVPGKPRENPNKATTWLDASSLYGSTTEYATSLRANKTGKLRSQMRPDGEYLPFNDFGLQMNAKPKQAQSDLFAGGDARTNEDWLLLGIHTLLLREHNRLCDILSKQRPDMDDEQLYQTVKLLVSSKFALIANTYQMTYWTNQMAWPRDDGFPLYRAMLGKGLDEVNPYHTYPWEYVTRPNGQPQIASQEMAMVYRFHEFIIGQLPLVDANNKTYAVKELIETGFDAKGFMETGIDNVLRGMVTSTIPNFKSGVDETFRSAGAPGSGVYRGFPFDIVVASIVHEREQGLPTFNQYFRKFNTKVPEPATKVPIREKFEDFSSDPEAVANLKKLYKTPDDVDLVVGTQLDEAMFPGTTVPLSALIVSLFSLFGLGNSDRFSPGYAITRCLLIDTPHNCRVTNALEDLIWKPTGDQPNHRWIDSFWVQEMDFAAHGQNLLWRLITENSNVKCLQYNPLFPVDHETNPILCAIPKEYDWKFLISNFIEIFVTFAAMGLLWAKHHPFKAALILTAVVIVIVLIVKFFKWICCGKKQKQTTQAKRKSVKKVTKQA